ncbi:MAG: MotA/TolQ/ExbB proton channel family protein [Burkholderiales bacterium]|nr:MotA/TolQ/ExbB proton channel family protein [Burkholderiales bacterium]
MSLIAGRAALLAALVSVGVSTAIALGPPQAHAQSAKPIAAPASPSASSPDAPPAKGEASPKIPPPRTETIENPYGVRALWQAGDLVARGTLIALIIMSVGSWYILITKLFEQRTLMKQSREANNSFWSAGTVQQGLAGLKEGTPFRFIAESGVQATQRHEGLLERVDLNTWVTMSIQRAVENVQNRLQDGLAFLATVGSTAPFVGLFGTVWAIYHALTAIGIAGQASIDKVAGPVGEALIMTALGLAVAVPAVLAYNWLVRRNKIAMETVRAFSAELHSVLIGGANAQAAGAPGSALKVARMEAKPWQ